MDNRPLALVIWTINVALVAVLAFVVYTFLIQPQSPGRPAYVPVEEDLPELAEPRNWQRIDVHELARDFTEGTQRSYNDTRYRALSSFDYHRLYPPDPPRKLPQQEERPEPEPDPPPTAEEALADLMERVEIVMLSAPYDALVLLRQRNERITIAPAEHVPSRGPRAESPPMVTSNLQPFGIPAEVLEIVRDGNRRGQIGGVRVRYTYREEEFELLLPRPYQEDAMQILRELDAQREGGDAEATGEDRPVEPGRTARAGDEEREPDPQAEADSFGPDPDFPETIQLGEHDWVIGWDEARHVNESVDDIVDELRPRQYVDPDTGERGVQVTNVPSDSHASRRGFVSGDIIKSINETPVTSRDEAIDYVRNNLEEPEFRVVLIRQGREQRLTYRNPRYHND